MTGTRISGTSRRSYAAVLKYFDDDNDIAVLQIAGQGFDFFRVVARPVRNGERVYAIGNPSGLEQTITDGIVSGSREDGGHTWIQHSAPISPGSSGGCLDKLPRRALGD
jgi:S1-C subfamily serine protease